MRRRSTSQLLALAAAAALSLLPLGRAHAGGSTSGAFGDNPAAAAFKDVRAAQSEITKVVADLRREFDLSPELSAARSDLQRTSADYQNTCAAAVESLSSTVEYKRAAENLRLIERRLEAIRYDDKITYEQRASLSRELLAARSIVSQMQAKALAADPNVDTARYAWQDANGKVIALRRNFLSSIASNPAFTSAKSRLESAHQRIAGMRH
jgi:hypothetical protein